MKRKLGWVSAALLALFVSFSPAAQAASDEQDLIDKARITLDDVHKDKEFGTAKDLLRRSKAVMIVPGLFKGGFFVGGEGGTGVLLFRHHSGWSSPAFYTLFSASFGLQIGAEQAELILFALSDKARNAFLSDEFKIGAQAGLAVVTLGSTAEAATTSNLNADIVVWSSASGAYAGLTLNGSLIKPRDQYNQAYYGRPLRPAQILKDPKIVNPGADGLRSVLARG